MELMYSGHIINSFCLILYLSFLLSTLPPYLPWLLTTMSISLVALVNFSYNLALALLLNVSLTQKGHIKMVLVWHLFAWCHTGTLSLAQLECPTQSQYTDTGSTSPDTNLLMPTPSETVAKVPIFKTLVCLGRGGIRTPDLQVPRRTP